MSSLELLDLAEDFLLGFSKIRSSTILPHCFLSSFEMLDIVTLNEYLGYSSAFFTCFSKVLPSSEAPNCSRILE